MALADGASPGLRDDLEGETASAGVLVGPRSSKNAAALRKHLPWLRPRPARPAHLGRPRRPPRPRDARPRPRAACGGRGDCARLRPAVDPRDDADRPHAERGDGRRDLGHVRRRLALRARAPTPITSRRRPTSTPASPSASRMFTIDPGEHVDSAADSADVAALRAKMAGLPWSDLADSEAALRRRYLGQSFAVEHLKIQFDEATLLRAAVKYGRAVAHVARMCASPGEGRRGPSRRAGGLGGRDRDTDRAGRALLGRERAAPSRRRLGEPRPALRRPFREGRRLHRRPRGARAATSPPTPRSRASSGRTSSACTRARTSSACTRSRRASRRASSTSRPRAPATSRPCARWPPSTRRSSARSTPSRASATTPTRRATTSRPSSAGAPRPRPTCRRRTLPALLEQFDSREILHVTFGSVLKEVERDRQAALQGRPVRRCCARNPEAYAEQPGDATSSATCGRSSR